MGADRPSRSCCSVVHIYILQSPAAVSVRGHTLSLAGCVTCDPWLGPPAGQVSYVGCHHMVIRVSGDVKPLLLSHQP